MAKEKKPSFKEKRKYMVEFQLRERGIKDPKVLKAFAEVPRHEFVHGEYKEVAYADYPLPIEEGQTISQPYIVALMTELMQLKGNEKVLEIGAGSGYQAAILSKLCKKVYTIERHGVLAQKAKERLKEHSCKNVEVIIGDGTLGLKKKAPFDAIMITAAGFDIPEPLIEQLKEGGRIVAPIGNTFSQTLKRFTKVKGELKEESICGCAFVPLIGKHGLEG